MRANLLRTVAAGIRLPDMGPEKLRSMLAQLRPSDLGIGPESDPVLERFQVSILAEGSGTQIFSTTFAQWTAREALRRAQPVTMLVRFAPRQRQRSINELLSANETEPPLDPVGSLIDADMAAYYNWVNLQRLSGAEHTTMLAWFEDHAEALLIAPSVPRGTQSLSAPPSPTCWRGWPDCAAFYLLRARRHGRVTFVIRYVVTDFFGRVRQAHSPVSGTLGSFARF